MRPSSSYCSWSGPASTSWSTWISKSGEKLGISQPVYGHSWPYSIQKITKLRGIPQKSWSTYIPSLFSLPKVRLVNLAPGIETSYQKTNSIYIKTLLVELSWPNFQIPELSISTFSHISLPMPNLKKLVTITLRIESYLYLYNTSLTKMVGHN